MTTNEASRLLLHEHWANLQVLGMLDGIPVIPEKAMSIFNHLVAAHENWYARVTGVSPGVEIWWDNADREQWRILLAKYHSQWMQLISGEEGLNRSVSYKNSKGTPFTNSVEEIVLHLCMHSQYHRGQVVTLVRHLVESPPSTDFIAFLRLT